MNTPYRIEGNAIVGPDNFSLPCEPMYIRATLAAIRVAYAQGRFDSTAEQLIGLTEKLEKADAIEDERAMGKVLADIDSLPENDADAEEAAAIAREQDEQHRRTVAATYGNLATKITAKGGRIDVMY